MYYELPDHIDIYVSGNDLDDPGGGGNRGATGRNFFDRAGIPKIISVLERWRHGHRIFFISL